MRTPVPLFCQTAPPVCCSQSIRLTDDCSADNSSESFCSCACVLSDRLPGVSLDVPLDETLPDKICSVSISPVSFLLLCIAQGPAMVPRYSTFTSFSYYVRKPGQTYIIKQRKIHGGDLQGQVADYLPSPHCCGSDSPAIPAATTPAHSETGSTSPSFTW